MDESAHPQSVRLPQAAPTELRLNASYWSRSASWNPAAKRSSASASNYPECAGPSPAPMPSPPSGASRPAAPKTASGQPRHNQMVPAWPATPA